MVFIFNKKIKINCVFWLKNVWYKLWVKVENPRSDLETSLVHSHPATTLSQQQLREVPKPSELAAETPLQDLELWIS